MSTPIDQLQPPPTTAAAPPGHASVGPVIAVLAVISILGLIAAVIGRLCSGRPVLGYGAHYDVESCLETKCASCLDGSLDPPPPPPPPPPPEMKENHPPPENLHSTPPGSGADS